METQKRNRTARFASHSNRLYWFVFPVIIAAAFILFAWFLWIEDRSITEENGLLENLQLLFLSVGLGFHLKQRSGSLTTATRICHSTLALLCLSIILRELDIDEIGTTGMWSLVETVARLATAFAWLLIMYVVAMNFRGLWAYRWEIGFSITSVATAIAIVLYIVSWPFDKGYIPVAPDISQFIEESLQLTATVYLMAASLRPIRLSLKTAD